ncbi:MAG: hypothetical protein GX995_07265 [Clostridiales bacterium]|nr:hypothetical protein [Clostridiales bacterium]
MLEIETEYGRQEICIADIYEGNKTNKFPLAILQNDDNVENKSTNYYLLLKENDKDIVKEFVSRNDDIIILSPSKMLFDISSIFMDNKEVIHILVVLFSISAVTIVLYSTIILYQGRNNEFRIYEVYGATEKLIHQKVEKECIFMAMIISICGTISSIIFTYFIGKYSLPIRNRLWIHDFSWNWNNRLRKHFLWKALKTGFTNLTKSIVISTFGDSVYGTPVNDFHTNRAILACFNLFHPILHPILSGNHTCC